MKNIPANDSSFLIQSCIESPKDMKDTGANGGIQGM